LPTQLTPEVAVHRRPRRRFQLVGAFILVIGAVAGSYTALSRDRAAHEPSAAAVADANVSTDPVAGTSPVGEAAAQVDAAAKAAAAAAAQAEQVRKANEVAAAEQAAQQQAAKTPSPNVPTSCNQYTGNRALGCAILLEIGFGLDQMGCLDAMWTKESGWNERSENASSGAYGIPQALPASKMAPYGADYLTNPVPQIRWGLDYIKGRYSTPCGAWDFWQAHSWY
jgi:hypothetical protein